MLHKKKRALSTQISYVTWGSSYTMLFLVIARTGLVFMLNVCRWWQKCRLYYFNYL